MLSGRVATVAYRAFASQPGMSSTIRVAELKELIKKAPSSLRLLDATYSPAPACTPEEFAEKKYGKFDELMAELKNPEYEKEHIPGAVHFHNDIACFPSRFQKASLYPPALFQEYARKLGLNESDDVVVYGRGAGGGMMFASRAWWLLRAYGMERVRVLEGGIERWKAEGGATTAEAATPRLGNWTAKEPTASLLATFEELFEGGSSDGAQRNLLDARPHPQYTGAEPLTFPPNGAPGAHLKGAKNVPIPTLLTPDGELKEASEITNALNAAGYDPSKNSVTYCNAGTQASMLGLALAKAGHPFRVYNGSLIETSRRAPQLISEKGE